MNKIVYTLTFLLSLICNQHATGQGTYRLSQTADTTSSAQLSPVKKRPYLAGAEVVLLDVGLNAFDHYALNSDYAIVNGSTVKNNFETGFVWDNDSFSTNFLWHPYHGSIYFNAARSNGMNFWESAPYSLAGSLIWEFLMENEPASINDVFSTTMGGIALGEVSYRSSLLILDNSTRGAERVAREFIGAIVSPMNAINRLTRGEVWKSYPSNSYESERHPFLAEVSAGWRHIAETNSPYDSYNGATLELSMKYGDPFFNDTYKPFEYFTVDILLNVGGNQPDIGSINAIGMLWGKSFNPRPGHDMTLGFFQHYDFYQTTRLEGSSTVPFELAQSAALGGGLIYKFPENKHKVNFSYSLFANAILMGGAQTDYFTAGDRDYNMGSGYSLKFRSMLTFGNVASLHINAEQYRLYTWKGYPNEPNPIPPDTDIKHLNAQGNEGNISFSIISSRLAIRITKGLNICIAPSLYLRHSHYKYFPDVDERTLETRLMLTYRL